MRRPAGIRVGCVHHRHGRLDHAKLAILYAAAFLDVAARLHARRVGHAADDTVQKAADR